MTDRLATETVLSLVDLIYSAGCTPELWPQVTAAYQQVLPESGFSFLLSNPDNELDAVSCGHGYDPCSIQQYVDHYHAINPYLPLIDGLPSDKVAKASDHVSQEWLKSHQFYHEWLKPAGDFTFGATLPIRSTTGRMLRVTFDVPQNYADSEAVAADLLQQTAVHFRRAVDISSRLEGVGRVANIGQALLDRLSGAAFVVQNSGKIVGMNASAAKLLRSGGTFQSNGTDRLQLSAPRENELLQRAIKSVTGIELIVAPTGFSVVIEGTPRPVVVLPLQNAMPITAGQSSRLALVQVNQSTAKSAPPAALLRTLYNLTKAEALVVQRVTEGHAIKDVADSNETSQSTVRNQLQAAMQKLNVHRQAEMVALVAGLTPRLDLED